MITATGIKYYAVSGQKADVTDAVDEASNNVSENSEVKHNPDYSNKAKIDSLYENMDNVIDLGSEIYTSIDAAENDYEEAFDRAFNENNVQLNPQELHAIISAHMIPQHIEASIHFDPDTWTDDILADDIETIKSAIDSNSGTDVTEHTARLEYVPDGKYSEELIGNIREYIKEKINS